MILTRKNGVINIITNIFFSNINVFQLLTTEVEECGFKMLVVKPHTMAGPL